MKSISKKLLTVLVIAIFCIMSIGSSESSEENKTITSSDNNSSEKDNNQFPTIEEQILFENKGIRVTAKEITEDWLGPQLKVLIENDSNANVIVSLDAIAVNDYMVSAWLYEEVGSSKKSNATFDIWSSTLSDAGINNIGKIDMYFKVLNADTFSEIYDSGIVEIQTSLYNQMDTKINDIGEEMINQNGIRIVGKGVSNDAIWGSGVVLYIENNTDKSILVTTDNLSVNGYMITSYLYSTVKPSKKSVETIILSSTDLQENDIDNIEQLSLSFDIINPDTFSTITKTKELSFNIE